MDTTSPTLAVTGSTGSVGGAVARHLAGAGVPQRLLVRDVTRAPRLDGSSVVACSYSDRDASVRALTGVHTLFMVSASESADRLDQHRAFVDSARAAGVRQLVYTSFVGAAPDATFTLARDHYGTEQHIRGTGMQFTFLRDNLYLDFMENLVGEDGVIRGPAGQGRVAAVARADVARTAAVVLQEPAPHRNQTYNLTGPEAVTLAEVAQLITGVRGSSVTFHDETVAEAYASRQKWGAPGWQNDAWVSTYLAIAAGELAAVSDDIAQLTGQPPLSLAQLLAS